MPQGNGQSPAKFRQLDLFAELPVDVGFALKDALVRALKASPLSRDQVAEELGRLAALVGYRQPVTTNLINTWCSPGKNDRHICLRLLPHFCAVVGSTLPLEVLAAAVPGARVISEEDYRLLQWAKAEVSKRKAAKQARRLAEDLEI